MPKLTQNTETDFVSWPFDMDIDKQQTPKEIDHFRVPLCLCFKASLSAKPFL